MGKGIRGFGDLKILFSLRSCNVFIANKNNAARDIDDIEQHFDTAS